MGQSTSSSTIVTSPLLLPINVPAEKPPELREEDSDPDSDYTKVIPDDCLAYVFHFLGAGDRKSSSVVCRRWLRVDGERRHRLSLDANSEILSSLPSIFARFESVTKLALRCDRKSISLDDDAFVMISVKCPNLTRLKLRGCREITDHGMAAFAQHCRSLKKFSCGSCSFGAKGMNAVLENCTSLEELSIKRLRGIHDGTDLIGVGAAAPSLKSICLKELVNGQSFEPLVIGAKNLRSLKIFRCVGDWDKVLKLRGKQEGSGNGSLTEIHLERIQVSDAGLIGISKFPNLEILHLVKTPECSNSGLISVAENCRKLRKLHIDGWRTNRIGDHGLIAIAEQCSNLEELVLIGVNATHMSLGLIAGNCRSLERLALCGSGTIRDEEIACISEKCTSLKKLCIKGCAISDKAIATLAWGFPNLVKVKVKKCRWVSSGIVDWLQERKPLLAIDFDAVLIERLEETNVNNGGVEDMQAAEFPVLGGQVIIGEGPSNNAAGRMAAFRSTLGDFASRNIVACAFSRWSNSSG
ncbi:F-box protein SKIP2 [Linum perenne]